MKVRQVLASALLLAAFSVAAFAQGRGVGATPSADELWQTVREANDVDLLEAFITGFPESRHIPEARQRLAGLKPGSGAGGTPPTAQPLSPRPGGSPSRVTTVAPPPSAAHERSVGPDSGSTVFRVQLFPQPRQGAQASMSMRVDWCLRWANDCGKPAADAFCRSQGFERAKSFANELTGGPTWVIGDRQICAMKDCRALESVQCEGFGNTPAMPAEAIIELPRINGAALSACLHPSRGCGQEAASAYCVAAGYAGAKAFGQAAGGQSIHLGDRSPCSGAQCRSITHVVCSR
jgi:hypothetical protein